MENKFNNGYETYGQQKKFNDGYETYGQQKKFNDGYEIYGQESNSKGGYRPMSYEEAVEQRSHHQTFQDRPNYRFPFLEKAAGIMKIASALFILLFAVFFALGYATHGGVFLLTKTQATVTKVDSHTIYVNSDSGGYFKTVYDLTLNYDHKGKNYTMYAKSDYDKSIDSTVYVYVNKIDPYSVWYIDSFGVIIKIVAIALGICAFLLVASIALENYGRNQFLRDYDPEYGKSKFYPKTPEHYMMFGNDLFND